MRYSTSYWSSCRNHELKSEQRLPDSGACWLEMDWSFIHDNRKKDEDRILLVYEMMFVSSTVQLPAKPSYTTPASPTVSSSVGQ
jgi:hypothetical protein